MNFVKKNLKWIITIIGVIIVTTGISVYATGQYLASQVNYTRDNETITVNSALDELYGKIPSGTKTIEANGTYDVTNFATAVVQNLYTKQQYDAATASTNYWKYDKLKISKSDISNYEYICGFSPKFVYIHYTRSDQEGYAWSEDGTTFWLSVKNEKNDGYTLPSNITSNFEVLENGLKFIGWKTSGDYEIDIWTIK